MKPKNIVTISGLMGSGKTTAICLIYRYFAERAVSISCDSSREGIAMRLRDSKTEVVCIDGISPDSRIQMADVEAVAEGHPDTHFYVSVVTE